MTRRHFPAKPFMGGGETRIYSRNGAPIGLIAAGGSIVAAPVRKVEQILRHFSNFSGDGKLRSQRVQCIQIMDDCRLACARQGRSEEHTSELQSLMRISYAVFCLKKK